MESQREDTAVEAEGGGRNYPGTRTESEVTLETRVRKRWGWGSRTVQSGRESTLHHEPEAAVGPHPEDTLDLPVPDRNTDPGTQNEVVRSDEGRGWECRRRTGPAGRQRRGPSAAGRRPVTDGGT